MPIWSDFMSVALADHPEWGGDWERPAGVEEVEINPKTGAVATPEDVDRRVELFIAGTGPNTTASTETAEPSPDEQEQPTPDETISDEPLPQASPSPTKSRPTPTPDGARLEGTITLDVDPTTGLIAVESCPVVRTRTYVLGTEPKRFCGPEYHKLKTVDPGASRPRTVATPHR